MMSGLPVSEDFKEGWAYHFFVGEKAHYWKRVGPNHARMACLNYCKPESIRQRHGSMALADPGDTHRCKNCERARRKAS